MITCPEARPESNYIVAEREEVDCFYVYSHAIERNRNIELVGAGNGVLLPQTAAP